MLQNMTNSGAMMSIYGDLLTRKATVRLANMATGRPLEEPAEDAEDDQEADQETTETEAAEVAPDAAASDEAESLDEGAEE